MIWLPDGDEILDREKQRLQSPKLMLTFVSNPKDSKLLMPCHVMPKGSIFTAAYYIEIFSRRSLLGVQRET
jgi:hypothetical protein